MKKQKHFLGIDIGGTSIKAGVIDEANNIINQNTTYINHNISTIETIKIITKIIENYCNIFFVESIGIGLPCVVNNDIIMMAPNLPN